MKVLVVKTRNGVVPASTGLAGIMPVVPWQRCIEIQHWFCKGTNRPRNFTTSLYHAWLSLLL